METPQRAEFSDSSGSHNRLDEIGWGLFLIMIGTIWLVPAVPPGTWLVATGALLLTLNAVRLRTEGKWSGFSTTLGVIALIAGLSDLFGVKLPLFAICLVVFGAGLLLKPLIAQRT